MIGKSNIRLEVANGKDVVDITQLVQKISWSGSYKQACRQVSFSLVSAPYDNAIPRAKVECGNIIRLFDNNKELFRGYIQSKDISFNSNSVSYMALDGGTYVLRNEFVYNFKDKTAEEITQQVCKDLGINTGSLATTGEKMDKKFFGKGGYDIIMTAYTHASTKTKKKYMCRMREGKLDVIEKGTIVLDLAFENKSNIINSSFSEDVSSMVNMVKVYNGDEQSVKTVTNADDMKNYGTFSKVLKLEDGKDVDAEAKKILKKIDRKATIEGFGDTTCVTGFGVKVKDIFTGLVGLFYIDEDTHIWENGIHKIKLTLAFENMMHEVDAEDKETESSSTGSGTGREVTAEYTAYYPSNDPLQGGYKAANGETLDPKKNTCAAPKDIAFNTNIKVLETGTSQDGKVFRVNDRGGAIKVVNGVYKIDLLMANKTDAYAFGRRKGKVLIMDGSGSSDSSSGSGSGSSSGGNQRLVELAKSKLGCKYVWGATGPTTFDCSGLMLWCHKQMNLSIPRTSLNQSMSGKRVDRSALQPGDVICWKTTGAAVGHVGMYIGNGQFIHAPNKNKPVKIDNLSNSYYNSRYVCARRYW